MNRQEAAQILPLIEAFIAGKTIQYLQPTNKSQALGVWTDMDDMLFADVPQNYRIKPTPREWVCIVSQAGYLIDASSTMVASRPTIRVREILD